jgi:hypothetical protein
MSPSKLPLLFLAIFLAAPWTAARAADPCDRLLVNRAVFTPQAKRAQLAATQLITAPMYDSYRRNIVYNAFTLLGRRVSDFDSYAAFDDWRRLEAGKDFFEYGEDSARAAIVASTTADSFYDDWKKCRLDEMLKQPPPALLGWVEKLEPGQATIKLVASAEANPPLPEMAVDPKTVVVKEENPTQSRQSGRLTIERLVTVRRFPRADLRLLATSGTATAIIVVPSAVAASGSTAEPQVQGIDAPPVREPVVFTVPMSAKGQSSCFRPKAGETFDVATIRVTASTPDGGYWKVTKYEKTEICVEAGETARSNPKQMVVPYVVHLRVDKYRPRTAAD